jgi:hypothetical protein
LTPKERLDKALCALWVPHRVDGVPAFRNFLEYVVGGQVDFIGQVIERIANAFRALFHRRYVRSLEEESARLRAENRALLNSLLGTAGIAPLESARPPGPLTTPLRRRSWPQIAQSLESSAAAKKTFPAREINATRKAEHGN